MDLTYVQKNIVTGVSIYSNRLLEGFKQCEFDRNIILLVTNQNRDIVQASMPGYDTITISLWNISRIPHLRGLLNLKNINKLIKKEQIDIFFSPFICLSGLYTTKVPFIGVFHDAQGFALKKSKLKQLAHNVFTKRILNKLLVLVTISSFAKSDILQKIPGFKVPIHLIYNSFGGIKNSYSARDKNSFPYILNVNTLEPYKNLITLVKAFNLLKDKIPHMLYVKAKRLSYWDIVILPYIKQNGLTDRVKLIESCFTETEMDNLYFNADLFVSPSLMEGFGATPIEAALHKIPVICSKETALFETTKGLLNYYEPATDEFVLRNKILAVLQSPKDNLGQIAEIFEESYSEKRQAREFISLFESVCIDASL